MQYDLYNILRKNNDNRTTPDVFAMRVERAAKRGLSNVKAWVHRKWRSSASAQKVKSLAEQEAD